MRGIYIYGLHKTATTFLHRAFRTPSKDMGYYYWEKPVGKWAAEIDKEKLFNPPRDIKTPFCMCPIRHYEPRREVFDNIKDVRHIFHVRDPRDCLVSAYYSFAYEHGLTGNEKTEADRQARMRRIQATSIDDFVLNGKDKWYKRYLPLKNLNKLKGLVTLVTYEDMVMESQKWLYTILRQMAIAPPQLKKYWELLADEFKPPLKEDPKQHKRQMWPGDYKRN